MSEKIRVLIVDDNTAYRQAFARNLTVQGMLALQAENADQARAVIDADAPDVIVTDLQMRTATEGLDLIRDIRAIDPCLPVIMISAVGSFDEGARASQLGATHVLSKARIEEDMTLLYEAIRESRDRRRRAVAALDQIATLRASLDAGEAATAEALPRLHAMMDDPALDPYVRGEAFEAAATATRGGATAGANKVGVHEMEEVDEVLESQVPEFAQLESDTIDALRMAEYLFQRFDTLGARLEVSRTTCFSYCFSVENQAKSAIRKRLARLLAEKDSLELIRSLLEKDGKHINMFFQQHLLQTIRDRQMDFTIDNVRRTFLRVLEHGPKYRPDGLKALGILLLTFGREYEFEQFGRKLRIENPLGLRGLEDNEEVLLLAQLLISLQHFRNPYIHPEISGREAISRIRETSIRCLNLLMKLH